MQTPHLEYEGLSEEQMERYFHTKYHSSNPLVRLLISGYFRAIDDVVRQLSPDDRILEVGCGLGESSLRIMQSLRGQHFEVSEYNADSVRKMREGGFPVRVKQESVYELQREDKSFECVMLLEVLEHLEDYQKALEELRRVAKKFMVIGTPNEPIWRILNVLRGKYLSKWGNSPGHINHWSSSALVRLLSEFGIVERVYKPLPWTIALVRV